MIQPSELRLGNKINHNGIICTVLGIDSNSWLQLDNEQLNTRCDDCEYITITEEWLLKAGAKRFGKDFTLHGIIIHTRKRGFVINKSVPMMEHLHQLQNFIFANRGKELEFKL